MRIAVPNDSFYAERSYVLQVLCCEMLGLYIELSVEDIRSTIITASGNKKLVIEDHFFRNYSEPGSYLSSQNLPIKIVFARKDQNPFLTENDLPIIFGDASIQVAENQITCGADILASSFFMLTRWEEYVNPVRDHHGRFPGHAAVAVKNNFIQRPVVNEYVEMLWKMLVYLGVEEVRRERNYQAYLTHDVDAALLRPNLFAFLKKMAGDMLKRKSFRLAISSLRDYLLYQLGSGKDPYDTFDFFMDVAEKQGLQAHFYFLSGGEHREDKIRISLRHPFVTKLIQTINDRDHIIGIHPSFDSFQDEQIFTAEVETLKKASPQPVRYGRQHFLRFNIPDTWRLWEKNNLIWDSSLYYPDAPGFRCGTCYDFPVFDILERKQLHIREMPLTAMEVSWMVYKNSRPEEMLRDITALKKACEKYKGNFVLLWHNTSFKDKKLKKSTYQKLIEIV